MPTAMAPSVLDRLHKRELGLRPSYSAVRGLYGDRKWVRDLDIVNELGGHSGCVNALSWSKSGRLLASGSDDQHLNIHAYQPDNSDLPFDLITTVATGHRANIFSVKFMPHSNDRVLITAAGDAEIRIFDVEYAGRSAASPAESGRRAQGFLHRGVRFLSEADTNAKVYRSHSDRVKRIVTESSPHLFLSCSEDGEVRQWDLRQPSSFYPRQRARGLGAGEDSNVPPPLISYKRHNLDLNTISCSPSQPHYIALGGAHLHCFLHDRRMLGRDRSLESGTPASPTTRSDRWEAQLSEATQCVRRFAPDGQPQMKRSDSGHITACKISDANPNELVVSWSGDYIYNFDMVRAPEPFVSPAAKRRAQIASDRKRKRQERGSMMSHEGALRASPLPRRRSGVPRNEPETMSLRVRYQNGQSESIAIEPPIQASGATTHETKTKSREIAEASFHIQKNLFGMHGHGPETTRQSLSATLKSAASLLPVIDEVSRSWRYSVEPTTAEVLRDKKLREHRQSTRRLVQASGVVLRLALGNDSTPPELAEVVSRYFTVISPAPAEVPFQGPGEQFSYDFLKAIVAWLDSGPGSMVNAFIRTSVRRSSSRFPIPEDREDIDAIDDHLIPYLQTLASNRPIRNIEASPFEIDENRLVFATESDAVVAFAAAVKVPFADLSEVAARADDDSHAQTSLQLDTQDRAVAVKFWGSKVALGLLLNAGNNLDYASVDRAFGGDGAPSAEIRNFEKSLQRRFRDISPERPVDDDELSGLTNAQVVEQASGTIYIPPPIGITAAAVASANGGGHPRPAIATQNNQRTPDLSVSDEDGGSERGDDGSDDRDGSSDSDDDDDDDDDDYGAGDDEEDEGDEDDNASFMWRSAFHRSAHREEVHLDVPCVTHNRTYRGHCNVKTVKDVNFWGLNDEYVVSGSDSGHVFIWDRHSSQLLNILEGDGEVVNVIQGHPHEPMLAVSGIDHTIKIFSPDYKARRDAQLGINVVSADASNFSSLHAGGRRFGIRRTPSPNSMTARERSDGVTSNPTSTTRAYLSDDEDAEEAEKIRLAMNEGKGLSSRRRIDREYQITSSNESQRQGGNHDALITRAMLAQLAQRMHRQQMGVRVARTEGAGDDVGDGEEDEEEGDESATIVINDDCNVM